ncbi:hypothetical protein ACFQ4Q_14535 [Lysobacter gummosus]|uniref:hypothetical protein n=1 Tax=Lysobacter gummosus TaxID=262324 RepID=UPI00363809DE
MNDSSASRPSSRGIDDRFHAHRRAARGYRHDAEAKRGRVFHYCNDVETRRVTARSSA